MGDQLWFLAFLLAMGATAYVVYRSMKKDGEIK
jgi:hypothetical protein